MLNHNLFKKHSERIGAHVDLRNIVNLLEFLQFEVIVKEDLKKRDIEDIVYTESEFDHSENDCFLLIVMTHGEKSKLFARDYDYDVDTLWKNFSADNCPSLAGKPKIFFINVS